MIVLFLTFLVLSLICPLFDDLSVVLFLIFLSLLCPLFVDPSVVFVLPSVLFVVQRLVFLAFFCLRILLHLLML